VATLPAIEMPRGEEVLWLPKRNESEEERERKSKRRMIHKEEESRFMVEQEYTTKW
jgi:hypothetical protein